MELQRQTDRYRGQYWLADSVNLKEFMLFYFDTKEFMLLLAAEFCIYCWIYSMSALFCSLLRATALKSSKLQNQHKVHVFPSCLRRVLELNGTMIQLWSEISSNWVFQRKNESLLTHQASWVAASVVIDSFDLLVIVENLREWIL